MDGPQDALKAIQLAIAPVFLLTAIAAMIGVLATRLGRIVDRARVLDERLVAGTAHSETHDREELALSRTRAGIVNCALVLLTVSAALIGATIVALFIVETRSQHGEWLVPWTFLGGLGCFIGALLCFLIETLLTMTVLDFGKRSRR